MLVTRGRDNVYIFHICCGTLDDYVGLYWTTVILYPLQFLPPVFVLILLRHSRTLGNITQDSFCFSLLSCKRTWLHHAGFCFIASLVQQELGEIFKCSLFVFYPSNPHLLPSWGVWKSLK
ncbi:hypothetical protein M758_7G152600 [Ceratodon purpureus]